MERKVVSTGISIEIPEGYYGRIAPRSGLAVREGIDVLAGVIDSNYRGEIGAVLINLNFPIYYLLTFKKKKPFSFSSPFMAIPFSPRFPGHINFPCFFTMFKALMVNDILANLIGIAVAAILNYLINSNWTWKK